jgi:predicted GTPase
VETASVVELAEGAPPLAGMRALVIEDGPTVTHGGMTFGAGALAAREAGATLVDPRPSAVGTMADTLAAYPHLTEVLPAMGYSAGQLADLEATVNGAEADVVVIATPIDLSRLIKIDKPAARVTYRVADTGRGVTLDDVVDAFCSQHGLCEAL